MPKLPNSFVGVAGEYLVASQLTLRGWLATITLKNAPGVDVLAQHAEDGILVSIQSKAMSASSGFRLGQKDEEPLPGANRGHDWFVLVNIKSYPLPLDVDYYIVPRVLASTLIYCGDKYWLAEPGRGGRKRNAHGLREIRAGAVEAYKEEWHLLQRPASEAPVLLPKWMADMVEKYGVQAARQGDFQPVAAIRGANREPVAGLARLAFIFSSALDGCREVGQSAGCGRFVEVDGVGTRALQRDANTVAWQPDR